MDFLLYYVLRRFFVKVEFLPRGIYLRRGLIIRRESFVPLDTLTLVEVKRTLLMRAFSAKKVTVRTLAGSVSFFLQKDESLSFLPPKARHGIAPKRTAVLLGAFLDTRALSGVVFFSGTLSRISRILGSEYYDRVMSVITDAADELAKTLYTAHIVIPRITAVIAVFTLAAWFLAFLRKLTELMRFRVSAGKSSLTITRGIVTLYEQTLVLNNLNSVYSESSVTSLLLRRAPLFSRGVMLFPPTNEAVQHRLLKGLCGISPEAEAVMRPQWSALFSHCCVPLWWSAGLLGVLWLSGRAFRSGLIPQYPVLRSALWGAAAVCLWAAFAFVLYMRRSFLSAGKNALVISARKGSRLRTEFIPRGQLDTFQNNVSLFQRKNRRRDICLIAKQGGAIKLRHANLLL
ncbi:MAG: hypothetical protein ACI4Q4_00450 [Oscillospiraceae bacterium]